MATTQGGMLTPPILNQIKNEDASRIRMERSVSQEIREERKDLAEAAEQTLNVILDLSLDGTVRWVSPSWVEVVGTPAEEIQGKSINTIVLPDEEDLFGSAVESMQQDDSKSQIIRFRIRLGSESVFFKDPALLASHREGFPQDEVEEGEDEDIITFEGQGIMVYDRASGGNSHTMWMLRPAVEPKEITIDLPEVLVETLGVGAEVLANHLTALAEEDNDPATYPKPPPILCRICERHITQWWFEKHCDLCVQEHQAESEVQQAHEALSDHRNAIVKVLDALEARNSRPLSTDPISSPTPPAEYKGLAIGPPPSTVTAPASGRNSPATPPRSRDTSNTGFGHSRGRSFAQRRPLARIVELILDLCDTALEIKTPALQENRTAPNGEFRTQSPQSENHISQVLNWQTPGSSNLQTEEGLAQLTADTEELSRTKVEATLRHRRIIEYAERIRIEFHVLVQDCIEAAIRKTQKIREGELSDTSDSEDDSQANTPAPQSSSFPTEIHNKSSPGPSAIQMALRNASEHNLDSPFDRRRSVAISTGSNSPLECPTPRSSVLASGILGRTHSIGKRSSLYAGSDQGDSDGSLGSSVLSSARRTESPNQDASLVRTRSSREKKRRSLKLHSISTASPRRHESPPQVPPAPPSPYIMTKGRISMGPDANISPVVSPVLSGGEPGSPIDHRRHSSITSSNELPKPPVSPRLSAINPPQPKAVPPSIKDFEIIKPISKGAFGSVYLSKKKATGDYYAIKVLKKSDMVSKNQVTNVKAERAIMMWQGESDFVAKLYWTFSSKDYLYLVMEYLNGGDCAALIKVLGGLPEDWARKYLAEVVLGVEHLHSRGIVHRDLKPDNLLIDHNGHLKLTDFGLSRMGLIGRQKRLAKSPENAVPDLLKQGPFTRPLSITSSRSTSFDMQGNQSPIATPLIMPDLPVAQGQPSYFNLGRDGSLPHSNSKRQSTSYRSDSGSSDTFNMMFKQFSLEDSTTPRNSFIEEEGANQLADSMEQLSLQTTLSRTSTNPGGTPPQQSSMHPPSTALFDPEDSNNRRFVGTPDYLAPETINGLAQNESSDWWSIGCILFEFLFGYPPFHADTPEKVFENILARNIKWPPEDEEMVSKEARDLMDKLMTTDTHDRLGSNRDEKYANGGEEVRSQPFFEGVNWDTLREDEAQFVPAPENPEDTEYFDARGATLQSFEDFEDQSSSPNPTPGADLPERPHDALSGYRRQVYSTSIKKGLMPLHIPPHVRDGRARRLSEPVGADDFGNFSFKNLPVLEKANKDVIQKLRAEAMSQNAKTGGSQGSGSSQGSQPSPSLDGSPLLASPLKRAISHKNVAGRSASPATLAPAHSSPHRLSQPTSPLLVQFSTGPHHERRKTSTASSGSFQSGTSLPPPGGFFDVPRLSQSVSALSQGSSPVKNGRPSTSVPLDSPEKQMLPTAKGPGQSSRSRSQTVGSQDESPIMKPFGHHKRRSQVIDVSPSSSDNEDSRAKALLRVQRRRQSSRRLSQFSINDAPYFRPLDILVCEDHPVSRMVMERLLEKLRCRTIACSNGSDAIRFATSDVLFDVIMMEVKLPQLSGTDVARMIRGTKNVNQGTPIIAVTGYLKELPANHHFDLLIDKPPTLDKLKEVLGNFCQWKPPPPDWRPGPQQHHQPSGLRQESHIEDSPSSQSSGPFAQAMSASFRGSSREDSVSTSSIFGEMDAPEPAPSFVIHDGGAGSHEWGGKGLGIEDATMDPTDHSKLHHTGLPSLIHQTSAPPILGITQPSPRRQPSSEQIRAKRISQERNRHECTESGGDDEDELLGDRTGGQHQQPMAPPPKSVSPQPRVLTAQQQQNQSNRMRASKLSSHMLRANSRGSIVSEEVLPQEARLAGARSVAAADVEPILAPPEIFPTDAAGDSVAEVIDVDATPRPPSAVGGATEQGSPTPVRR